MERLWKDSREPRLRDVFEDPIVQKRMASAGVDRDDLWRNIEAVRRGLLAWKREAEMTGHGLIKH